MSIIIGLMGIAVGLYAGYKIGLSAGTTCQEKAKNYFKLPVW